jgi:uncharacterized circularly permuted ATP-grasp superfamily protein
MSTPLQTGATSIWDAISAYHDLFNAEVAEEAYTLLAADLRRRKCYFGERPICTVLRPHFYLPAQWHTLKHQTEIVLSAFGKAHRACMSDSMLRSELYLEPYEETLFTLDIGFDAPWSTSRLDSFYNLETNELRFLEYNAETPAGMGYEDQLSEAFLDLDVFKRFSKNYHARHFHMRFSLLATLQDAYNQFARNTGRVPAKLQVAIIDWADVPTLNEHQLIKAFFESKGVSTVLADPRTLEYRNGALYAGDFRIDLIYKRVLCSELVDRMGIDNPVVQAVRDQAVCMSNAFSAKLMAKKASFTILSDERHAHLYTDAERTAIEAHIPWTRIVRERKTRFHGQEIDLLSYIADHREQFVLKPNDEYGGKGVLIGWECDSETWNNTLKTAITEPYVVQERVNAPYEDFPSWVDGKLDISKRLVDADPFCFNGRTVNGSLTRLSTVTLLNVTAGGGSVVPTFIIDKSH